MRRAQLWWAGGLLAAVPALAAGLILLAIPDEPDRSPHVISRVSDGPFEGRLAERRGSLSARWDLVLAVRNGRGTREVAAGCIAGDGSSPAVVSIAPGTVTVTVLDGTAVEVRFDPATLDVTQALPPELCGD
jgi:hypothetical protein